MFFTGAGATLPLRALFLASVLMRWQLASYEPVSALGKCAALLQNSGSLESSPLPSYPEARSGHGVDGSVIFLQSPPPPALQALGCFPRPLRLAVGNLLPQTVSHAKSVTYG